MMRYINSHYITSVNLQFCEFLQTKMTLGRY